MKLTIVICDKSRYSKDIILRSHRMAGYMLFVGIQFSGIKQSNAERVGSRWNGRAICLNAGGWITERWVFVAFFNLKFIGTGPFNYVNVLNYCARSLHLPVIYRFLAFVQLDYLYSLALFFLYLKDVLSFCVSEIL